MILALKDMQTVLEETPVQAGQKMNFRLFAGRTNFFFRQFQQLLQMAQITRLQQFVAQHGDQGRRQGQGQPVVCPVPLQPVQNLDQRNIAFGNGFEQPALFKKTAVLRMPDKGKMRMQYDAEKSFLHKCQCLPFPCPDGFTAPR